MKRAGRILLLLAAARLGAVNTYYVNRGVPYHIGDGRFSRSEDALFMATTNVVGPRWEQRFKVDRPDRVQVRIEKIWGIDDCPYCKVIISIDGKPMARLFAENNRSAFTTPPPLAVPVEPGRVHVLAIESVGGDTVDDFVIQDVVVETAEAEVELLPGPNVLPAVQAERPAPPLPEPPAEPACGPSQALRGWLGSGNALAGSTPRRLSGPALAPGSTAALELRVQQVAVIDAVSQALELRAGTAGWALNFAPGEEKPVHADRLGRAGARARRWDSSAWRAGQWNRLELRRCRDGGVEFFLNGHSGGKTDLPPAAVLPLELRLLGLEAEWRESEASRE